MQQQCDKGGRARTRAVVGQQRVFKLVLAHNVLGKFDVQFIFGPENLHVLRHVGGEILHSPRSQNCVLVLQNTIKNLTRLQ